MEKILEHKGQESALDKGYSMGEHKWFNAVENERLFLSVCTWLQQQIASLCPLVNVPQWFYQPLKQGGSTDKKLGGTSGTSAHANPSCRTQWPTHEIQITSVCYVSADLRGTPWASGHHQPCPKVMTTTAAVTKCSEMVCYTDSWLQVTDQFYWLVQEVDFLAADLAVPRAHKMSPAHQCSHPQDLLPLTCTCTGLALWSPLEESVFSGVSWAGVAWPCLGHIPHQDVVHPPKPQDCNGKAVLPQENQVAKEGERLG